ncbi:MAG TPA: hypothetical protein VF941_04845 [Clostridia bacterium]
MRRFNMEKLENVETPISIALTKWWHYALAAGVLVAAIILI